MITWCVAALRIHNEIYQPTSFAAGRAHPQTPAAGTHLDGLLARIFPWTAGAKSLRLLSLSLHIVRNRHLKLKRSALLCSLQVLKGDIRPAIETHEMLYQVTKKHNFLPEVR